MPPRLDKDVIHEYLWRNSDRLHRYRMNQKDLAEELGVSYYNFTVVIRGMAAQGRMRAIGGGKYNAKTYLIEDPATWVPSQVPTV